MTWNFGQVNVGAPRHPKNRHHWVRGRMLGKMQVNPPGWEEWERQGWSQHPLHGCSKEAPLSAALCVRVSHWSRPTSTVGLWYGHWMASNQQWVEPSLDLQVLHALRRRPNAHLCKEGSKTGSKEEKKPLCCGDSERASLSGCLYFVRLWFLFFSLSLSHPSLFLSIVWGNGVLKGHPSGLSEVGMLQIH